MKKLFTLVLALCMVFTLASCGGNNNAPSSTPPVESSSTPESSSPFSASTTPLPSAAPVEFDFSKVTEAAYSLEVEASGDNYIITIHDENLAETYILTENLMIRYSLTQNSNNPMNIFVFDVYGSAGEIQYADSVAIGNGDGNLDFDFGNKNIFYTAMNRSGTAWDNLELSVSASYGDEHASFTITLGTGTSTEPLALKEMTLPSQFMQHEWDSQYFKVATDDYMIHEVYDRWQEGQMPDTLADIVTVRSFGENGNVIYMVTKIICDTEEEARVYYEYLQGANVAAGDKPDQLCVNTGLVVYYDFLNVADKMNKQGNIDRYTAEGVNFWYSIH